MTDIPPQATGPVEAKTKAGALATYAGAFVLFAILGATGNDPSFLPAWASAVLLPLVPTLLGFLASWLKSHKPGEMSASALRAARGTGSV